MARRNPVVHRLHGNALLARGDAQLGMDQWLELVAEDEKRAAQSLDGDEQGEHGAYPAVQCQELLLGDGRLPAFRVSKQ
jgi:hypothetical protein